MAIQTVTVEKSKLIEMIKKQRDQWLILAREDFEQNQQEAKVWNDRVNLDVKAWNEWAKKAQAAIKSGKVKVVVEAPDGRYNSGGIQLQGVKELPKAPDGYTIYHLRDIKAWDEYQGYFKARYHEPLLWASYLRDFDHKMELLDMIQDDFLTFKLNDKTWGVFFN